MKCNRSPWRTAAMIAAAAVALTTASCSSDDSVAADPSSAATEDISLAAVLPNTSDPFWATISCGAEAKAEELGVDLKTYNSTSTDAATMASNFQTAPVGSPDGILVSPFNNNQFIAQYKTLMGKGVPVVTQTATEPPSEYKAISQRHRHGASASKT